MTARLRFALIVLSVLQPFKVLAQNSPSMDKTSAPPAAKRNLNLDDYFRIKDVEDAQISPDAKWVAYVVTTHDAKEDKDKKRIWMVATSGGDAIPLTPENSNSTHPRWSPDGKYLGFLSEHGDEKKQVWLLRRDAGEAAQLTSTIQDVDSFIWSPSGDRLLLQLQDASPEDIDAAKKKAKGVAEDEDKDKDKARTRPWVIDRLHFKEDEIGYLDHRRNHLYVFNIAVKSITQITSGDYDDSEAAWSPDGKSIAFSSNRTAEPDKNFETAVWVVAADNKDQGKSLVQVAAAPGEQPTPAWSPDGKWIAFTTQLDLKIFWYATYHLAIVPAAGGEVKILTKALDRPVSYPHFSADGRWIYFIAEDEGAQNLLRIPPAGGEITRPIGAAEK